MHAHFIHKYNTLSYGKIIQKKAKHNPEKQNSLILNERSTRFYYFYFADANSACSLIVGRLS